MCYTSGTTGNPKGVVYSHRSIWLHSMQCCTAETFGILDARPGPAHRADVPRHGLGSALRGLDVRRALLMPDRFLQPEPLARFIAAEQPDRRRWRADHLHGLLAHLDAHPPTLVAARGSRSAGRRVPGTDEGLRGAPTASGSLHAWGMTETSPIGSSRAAASASTGEPAWDWRCTRAGCRPRSRRVWSATTARSCATTARRSASSRCAVRGSPAVLRPTAPTPTRTSSTTAGCAPATSGRISPDGFLTLSTGPRT